MASIPEFRWAENDSELWVTIELSNSKDVDVKITADEVNARATSNDKQYSLQFKTKKALDHEKSSYAVRDRGIELKLVKSSESHGFWNHLLADSHKNALKQRIKIDWDLWRDEDEDDEKKPSAGFGEGGFPGFPGMGGLGGMDMSQLGDMGMGMGGDLGGAGGDSDDDDLPDLEEAPKDGAGKKDDEDEDKDSK